MYNDTITLFNRKAGEQGDTWYPSVLHNVQLIIDMASTPAEHGTVATDGAALSVRYIRDGVDKKVGEKLWLLPRDWQKLEDPSGALTFTTGDLFDFFWAGDWGSENPVNDSAFPESGDFYSHMNSNYDNVFAVHSVKGPYGLVPHFEIVGK